MNAPVTLRRLEEAVAAVPRRLGARYWLLVAGAAALAGFGGWCYSLIVRNGLQLTGLRRPVMWGNLITDFVFWVGIAHSGTLISAILFLFRAHFRTAVYRVAEMMTVFAVMTAGLFPVFHLGRPWFAYWLFPYPNQRGLWINFRSPLVWDVFAVSTYFTVSTIFLFVGIAPDAAALAQRASGWKRKVYGALSLGWRGTDVQWRHYTRAYLFFAAFATPLVVSVHSVVSWDFAVSIVPGWHSTLFPPYFVAGAILSGVAMVITLLVPLRRALHLGDIVTDRHLDMLSRLVLFTSCIVTYSYAMEFAVAWQQPAADPERSTLLYRATGPYAPLFWLMVACNCAGPLLLALRRVRASVPALLAICLAVNVGMWLERFNIVVSSLSHDRMPFSWRLYAPSWVEWGMTFGSFGWFFFWFLLSLKLLPVVSIAEMKEALAHEAHAAREAPGEPGVAHAR
ncbi:MAG TPA: NrfD/PsrC family molybdoenzyme membrane anchor subunit [Anaeromyxobacteraceae bacterium]|nr:NrfD/PsrC family molybdoenzyme membrane anchor subunit [Anaeromyxobacteraceae bacterium]